MNSFDETWSKGLGVKTISRWRRASRIRNGTIPAALVGMPPSVTGAQSLRDLYGGINLTHTIGTVH